ncbi:hypothetical protein EV426DRAFT_702572 [Tirmania nivea]|nr:hypothetical protein EV426DRAFT_702572 [Tirmania nivea]
MFRDGQAITLTDSTGSVQALLNLSRGAPPGSVISWVRSHIGISGNEKADRRVAYESALGCIAGSQQVATGQQVHMTQAYSIGLHVAAYQPGTTSSTSSTRSTLQPAPTATTAPRAATISSLTTSTTASNSRSSSRMPGHERTWTHQFGERRREKKRSGMRWRCTLPTSTSR